MDLAIVKQKAEEVAQDLQKGDYVEAKELERVFNANIGTEAYSWGMLHLRNACEKRQLVTKQENWGLRILDDKEAVGKTRKRFINKIKGARKQVHIQKNFIDTKTFNQEEKEEYYHTISVMDRIMKPVNDVVKEARLLSSSMGRKELPSIR